MKTEEFVIKAGNTCRMRKNFTPPVLVAWMKSWWVGGGACGVDEELEGGRM